MLEFKEQYEAEKYEKEQASGKRLMARMTKGKNIIMNMTSNITKKSITMKHNKNMVNMLTNLNIMKDKMRTDVLRRLLIFYVLSTRV